MMQFIYEYKGLCVLFLMILILGVLEYLNSKRQASKIEKCKHDQFKKIDESIIYDIDLNKSYTTTLKCLSCGKIIEVENANSNK